MVSMNDTPNTPESPDNDETEVLEESAERPMFSLQRRWAIAIAAAASALILSLGTAFAFQLGDGDGDRHGGDHGSHHGKGHHDDGDGDRGGSIDEAAASDAASVEEVVLAEYEGEIERVEVLDDGTFLAHVLTDADGEVYVEVDENFEITGEAESR